MTDAWPAEETDIASGDRALRILAGRLAELQAELRKLSAARRRADRITAGLLSCDRAFPAAAGAPPWAPPYNRCQLMLGHHGEHQGGARSWPDGGTGEIIIVLGKRLARNGTPPRSGPYAHNPAGAPWKALAGILSLVAILARYSQRA